ncbi:MAG: glycosyltransferase family 2 protein [Gammaproteobacteria bacterium]|nr:MAG: glycosyltransferase family 2 protein [Gammaproteobacteria bacterium]
MKKISVITPCFNEEDNIHECIDEVQKIFKEDLPQYELEHIFCDNCSSDNTLSILKQKAAVDRRIKIIANSRNFGILKNTYNGVLNATGDAAILFMPVDLQDPPELILEFVKQWEKGYEIVYGIRAKREENFFIKMLRKAYYRLLSACTYVDYPPDVGDFQLVDRVVLNAMKQIDDAQPFMRLMTFDCGFRSFGIPYTWRARKNDASRNSFMQMISQGMNGFIGFSNVPLRLALFFGLILSGFSFFYAFFVGIMTVMGQTFEAGRGIPTVIVALFFFSGIQLLFAGILGEYILAIYNQVRRKPLVIEKERINFD